MQRTIFNFLLAIEGVMNNRLRAILTALGIILGVGAVIAVLAIGNGAQKAILDQLELTGTNNIIITAETRSAEEALEEEEEEKAPWSPGLTMEDVAAIERLLPTVERISPEVVLPFTALRAGKQLKTRCVGTTNAFFELNNIQLSKGTFFHDIHLSSSLPVCIIGYNVQAQLFSGEDPLGKKVKCGPIWFTVIGVLEKRVANEESLKNLGIRDYNDDIYMPVNTALLRLKNRALVKLAEPWDDDPKPPENYHQLDRLVIKVDDAGLLRSTRNVIARMLKRRHRGVVDYSISIPEVQIAAQQKTQEDLNFALAAIAGISLLVGGIGIMNIMLASVLERVKEIGIRRSLGATRGDITWQFLFESVFISLIGGVIGILVGIAAAVIITRAKDIPTVISVGSILLSFGVAASVGLVFGLFPAQKAARQDPIKALRSD